MKRLRDTLLIAEFALRTILLVWQESKVTVRWDRRGKQLSLVVNVYNHLFDDECGVNRDSQVRAGQHNDW